MSSKSEPIPAAAQELIRIIPYMTDEDFQRTQQAVKTALAKRQAKDDKFDEEIKELASGLDPRDRPDLLAAVYQIKADLSHSLQQRPLK